MSAMVADNRKFRANANDAQSASRWLRVGNRLWSGLWERDVWYHAFLCREFGLNPLKDIVGHYQLDPFPRTDRKTVFSAHGLTMNECLPDVRKVYKGVKKGNREQDGVLSLGDHVWSAYKIFCHPQKGGSALSGPLDSPRQYRKSCENGTAGSRCEVMEFRLENWRGGKKVQRRHKLICDGIVGPRSWNVLF
jgi:hypothetical protein